jgi:hypothetical protein
VVPRDGGLGVDASATHLVVAVIEEGLGAGDFGEGDEAVALASDDVDLGDLTPLAAVGN